MHECPLCHERTSTRLDWPCELCAATELDQEEEQAEAMLDREEYLRFHNWNELTADERSHYEAWLDDIA